MSRNRLHKAKIGDFKAWLGRQGMFWREGRGEYQILQVEVSPNTWWCVYRRADMKEHYTVDSRLDGLLTLFLNGVEPAPQTQLDELIKQPILDKSPWED